MNENITKQNTALRKAIIFPHELSPAINSHNRRIHSLLRNSSPAQEQGLINNMVVRRSGGLGVNHTLSIQAGIIILLFAAGLPAAAGPSAWIQPALASLRLSCDSGISRLQRITRAQTVRCVLRCRSNKRRKAKGKRLIVRGCNFCVEELRTITNSG